MSSWIPAAKKAFSWSGLLLRKGKDRDRGSLEGRSGGPVGDHLGCPLGDTRRRVHGGIPKNGKEDGAHGEESPNHHQLRCAHPLPPLLPVIPGQDEHDKEPEYEPSLNGADETVRESPRLCGHVQNLKNQPGPRQADQRPLDQLAFL